MPAILNHASGSANPATSLSALWAYLQPALDHIVKSTSNDPSGKAPAIDFGLYAGIHSACYNYFTAQGEANAANSVNSNDPNEPPPSGTDIYVHLDKYFAEAAREIALSAPLDHIALIQYIVPSFNRFHAGAQSANRLLNYVNRHYVKRALDEDKGWLRLTDVLESVAKMVPAEGSREAISKKFQERKVEELKKWGYDDGCSSEQAAFAESCAEAASSLDRIVPISSLALRRLRTEFIEPLLAAPKFQGKSKAKNKIPKTPGGTNANRPKGRLARAVQELLESDIIEEEQRSRLVSGLAMTMQTVGVRGDHPLRKKLNKYIASIPLSPKSIP
ncbi:hypothetical protein M413DRAFT_22542 [Hebeloma cylindrosporum]|uniref:Cullin N-terminal domain-containing protein n=1 Tax=Hebeloma cylindrosporum TaxID=76867 RepID=A0A0C3CVT6_HEBCY|nr:hypothetical protein M413DRAFT_22542 [Hebeloma cylindrosporum h7]